MDFFASNLPVMNEEELEEEFGKYETSFLPNFVEGSSSAPSWRYSWPTDIFLRSGSLISLMSFFVASKQLFEVSNNFMKLLNFKILRNCSKSDVFGQLDILML